MDPEIIEALRRNSGIRLTGDGDFHHRGGAVSNLRVQALFHRGTTVREDGEVVLHVGDKWCYVACEGVAHFVEGIRCDGDRVVVRLRGGEERDATGAAYGYGPDDRIYVWLSGVVGPAILLRAAHQVLLSKVDDDGALVIVGRRVPLPLLAVAPTPGSSAPAQGRSGAE